MSAKNPHKQLAIEEGRKTFFDGKPCANGHVAERYTRSSMCLECQKGYVRKYRERNPNAQSEADKRFYQNHKEHFRIKAKLQRLKRGGIVTQRHAKWIKRLLKLQRGLCAYCRCDISKGFHVDHIMPVALGGDSDPSNLQLTCATCNQRKAAKDPFDFAKEVGRLI